MTRLDAPEDDVPPAEIVDAAETVGNWFAERSMTGWELGPCASRDEIGRLRLRLIAFGVASTTDGYKILKDTTYDERSWPGDAGHENGNYSNTCCNCGRQFTGHKRRVVCRSCAGSMIERMQQE